MHTAKKACCVVTVVGVKSMPKRYLAYKGTALRWVLAANLPRSYFHGDDWYEKQAKVERRLDSWHPIDCPQARAEKPNTFLIIYTWHK